MTNFKPSLPEACRTCPKEPELTGNLEQALVELSRSIGSCASDMRSFSKSLESAFPGGDIEGHRRYHEAVIADVEAKKKLTQAIKEKTISGLVWAFIVWVGIALWHDVLAVIWRHK